ncbi:MAG: enoyl-CoA hydratase [Crocinitomicaceae bacterium]|nr:enoyl-CoA hydratase [Crocinitomicaceae bacterium]
MSKGNVTIETNDQGVATVEFFHSMSNSLPGEILSKLANTISDAGKNNKIKVIILKSSGDRTFCAGASFEELSSISNFEEGKKFFLGFANVINAARECPKLIIGRIQGKAVGGGVGMASAVDYCIATKYASVKLSELALGIGPFVVGPAVERKIGTSAMSTMAINATKWYTADWAKNKGLYAEVFENSNDMDEHIETLSLQLAHSNPEATTALKKIFWEGTENWGQLLDERAAISGKLILSKYSREAINAIKNK